MEDSNSLTIVESFRLRKNGEIFFLMRSKTQVFPGTHVLDEEYTEREGGGGGRRRSVTRGEKTQEAVEKGKKRHHLSIFKYDSV